jgi:hypothetical protein
LRELDTLLSHSPRQYGYHHAEWIASLLEKVMTPPQSGGLTVVSSPKGCQGYRSNDFLEFAVFIILALSLKLILPADVAANLLLFETHG